MTSNIPFTAQALKALREIEAELGLSPAPEQIVFPGLTDVLDKVGPLPHNALLLGVASDGMPLLLNLSDPTPGPILVTGDRDSGKTAFLKMLARAASSLLPPEEIQVAVLTNSPAEWQDIEAPAHLLGMYPVHHAAALDLLYDLACRAEQGTTDRSILLLFDGLDSALYIDPASQDNLRYLLQTGPQARIWPVISLNAAIAMKLPEWVSYFRTRIYGRIAQADMADELTPIPGAALNTLFPGTQFVMRRRAKWLKFWLPGL
jgi:hypothetical protein